VRVTHLAAGAAGMHCGACARDAAMARALIARGQDVRIVPLYTPLHLEGEQPLPITQVHLGALNAYLQQVSGLFARLPRPITRALDHPRLLDWISRFAVSTSPSQLGPMTSSVLAGEDGRQRHEVGRLLDFLAEQARPDVVTITNSMLSGMAPAVKRRLGVPVICEVKGEDGFIESIPEPHRTRAIELIRRNAASVDRFVAPGEWYADRMVRFLDVQRDRIAVVRTAIDSSALRRGVSRPRRPFTLGYLSAITPRKGMHVLVEAAGILAGEGRELRLRIAGQVLNRRYWRDMLREMRRLGIADRHEYLGDIDEEGKRALLHSVSAFCQPSIEPEALGTAALEAQAAGVPVVAPREGAFPEMLELTGGGLLFASGDAEELSDRVAVLMDDPDAADAMGEAAAARVAGRHSPDAAAEAMLAILDQVTRGGTLGGGDGHGEEDVQADEEGSAGEDR